MHVGDNLLSLNKNQPLHILAQWSEGESEQESFILCDQIRTVSRQRFRGKSLGIVNTKTLESVEYIISMLLNL